MEATEKLIFVVLAIGALLVALGITFAVIDMLIDHNCYQLTPNEFYQETICEKYWNKGEEKYEKK